MTHTDTHTDRHTDTQTDRQTDTPGAIATYSVKLTEYKKRKKKAKPIAALM